MVKYIYNITIIFFTSILDGKVNLKYNHHNSHYINIMVNIQVPTFLLFNLCLFVKFSMPCLPDLVCLI